MGRGMRFKISVFLTILFAFIGSAFAINISSCNIPSGADKILFYDDSSTSSKCRDLTASTGLSISGQNLTVNLGDFDTGDLSEGSNLYFTNERGQDSVGLMVTDGSLVYVDATPLLTRGALTGDITASQGSNTTTLATVNSNVGSFGSATQVGQFTTNAKGLITAASNVSISIPASQVSDFDTEVSNNTDVAANTAARHSAATVTDSSEIDFTLTGQNITGSLVAGSIDETKLDTSVNASLDLADSSSQPGDNISDFVNDAGYITTISGGDHGTLSGLSDDDHTQYSIISSQAGIPSSTPSRVGAVNIDTTNDRAYLATDTASSSDWDILLTPSSTDTLTNKSGNISQWTNNSGYLTGNQTITLSGDVTGSGTTGITTAIGSGVIVNADVNASAAIDASKLHDGSVSNTEFGYLDGVTSSIQTQFGTKVTGPASSTDNAITRFDSTTGKLVQDSGVTIDDSNVLSGATQLNVDNLRFDGNTLSTTDTNGNLNIDLDGSGSIDFVGSATASRFYVNHLGQVAINGGVPSGELFYATNEDTGLTRASMVFGANTSATFAGYEIRDISTGNNWKMFSANSTSMLRFLYNDAGKALLTTAGKLRLSNSTTTAAQARLHLDEDTPQSEMIRLQTSGLTGNAAIDRIGAQNGLDTTDATATTIATIDASTASRAYVIEAEVTARVTAGTHIDEVAQYKIRGLFKNVSGTVTQIGSTTVMSSIEDTNISAYDAAFTISGTNVLIQATGEASHTVRWRVTYNWRSV